MSKTDDSIARMASDVKKTLESCAEVTGVPQDDIGIKIWVLPSFYYWTILKHHTNIRAWLDFLSSFVTWPRMKLAADSRNFPSAGTRWVIGKGLIGFATFERDNTLYHKVVHSVDFVRVIDGMSNRDFLEQVDAKARLGRTRKEIGNLRQSYASMAAFSIRPHHILPPFGCITVHTSPGNELDSEQFQKLGESVGKSINELGKRVWDAYEYRLPKSAVGMILRNS